ncbi:MAG: FAD-dependent oxidoreductase [Candidatus Hodarchaeales archaeon]
MTHIQYRKDTFENFSSQKYDILVVGGGITGAGVARDAALRGFSVALVEKDDFGYGTSSGSSKLVHAGLRYVANKEFRLVRDASIERKKILNMLPHLTRPIRFLVPLHSDTKTSKSKMRLAVWLYDILAGFNNHFFHKLLSPDKTKELLPFPIREKNFQGAALYGDGQMDDARVTLEVILDAEKGGADVVNYCTADRFEVEEQNGFHVTTVTDRLTTTQYTIESKTIILACGHWNDNIAKKFDPDLKSRIRPTKGIHLVTKRMYDLDYAIVVPVDDGRIIFLVPFGDYLLVGTTDTDYDGSYDHIPVKREEMTYLIDAINQMFPGFLKEKDVVSAYSGIRPLILTESAKDESDVSRKHEISEFANNVFVISGGKFTTYRSMSKEMIDIISGKLGQKTKCVTDKIPMFGWITTNRKGWEAWSNIACENMMIKYGLSKPIAQHLLRYGKNYVKLLDDVQLDPEKKNLISDSRTYILAEIDYFIKYEKAVTLKDVMLRRTQIQLSLNQGLDCVDTIVEYMGEELGWSEVKKKEEVDKYIASLVWASN